MVCKHLGQIRSGNVRGECGGVEKEEMLVILGDRGVEENDSGDRK